MLTTSNILDQARKELLDLSTRNRLLSIPMDSKTARVIHVRDELGEQVFRLLVSEKKSFSFLPGRPSKSVADNPEEKGKEEREAGLPQPDDALDSTTQLPKRHVDSKLQTSLTPEGLQTRLLHLYHDAKGMIEEQGVNILYIALGQVKWFEADHADTARYAPLILVPVELGRKTAAEKFVLTWNGDDIEENLSLRHKLKQDFALELPEFPDEEQFDFAGYVRRVSKALSSAKSWEVLPNAIALGFFSFAKFLMFRDLDPENWPNPEGLLNQPLICGLLQDGFSFSPSLPSEDANLDDLIPVSDLDHVVDADSSQTLAIESARKGASLVIQGPPGTGKSQSITNIIATAVLDGKKVLFVAEKLAALEVVKRRLEREGLADLCLELHSNKSNKRTVIEEIGKTWNLGRPRAAELESIIPRLEQRRTEINRHVTDLHTAHVPSGFTPFGVIGRLSLIGSRGNLAAQCSFEGAEQWWREDYLNNRKLIEDLAQKILQMGLPVQNPWRGCNLECILQVDLDPLASQISATLDELSKLSVLSESLGNSLRQPIPTTLEGLEEQIAIAGFVAEAPAVDKTAICDQVWNTGLDSLRDLISQGKKFSEICHAVDGKVTEAVWEKDFTEARGQISAHGQSLFRIFKGSYRSAVAQLRQVLKTEMPGSYQQRLELVDTLIQGQTALRKLCADNESGSRAFGAAWRRERSDWSQLSTIVEWVARHTEAGLNASFRSMFAEVEDESVVRRLVLQLREQHGKASTCLEELFARLRFDPHQGLGVEDLCKCPIGQLRERLGGWQESIRELPSWASYKVREQEALKRGLGTLLQKMEAETLPVEEALVCFDRVYFSQLLRLMVKHSPNLARFDGETHEGVVAQFRELDSQRLALAKCRTLLAHYEGMPQGNNGVGTAGIVRSEMERKRGHRSVRKLLKDAGSVVQAIKPVFMMSPLSVAQFLEPGAVEFDLLVIDEASQVQPVDALGAVARCKQVVVVGDSKQLPPTKFFARLTSDMDEEDEEEAQPTIAQAQDMESILGLCRARGLPERMLRWHYRSRHHSLIAVSNHEFYEDKLFIVPSPVSKQSGLGLRFEYIPQGVFDSGASGTNRIEAQAVCRAIMDHAIHHPELSLGVAAFSVRQRDAIMDELELLRRKNQQAEAYFASHSVEPFFVKNLENVQGDERDVIFISVGYGKDPSGYMAMRFGPLGSDGGERRLNVLISRAKKRCHVFSSITADDIVLERARGRGVAALKAFLHYAQKGMLNVARTTDREEDSPFETSVRKALESLGYAVDSQVGQAGFFIDLAVRDPEQEGRYMLGIECDGASYHSARSARDRDRLRQAVLEDHGWTIVRIWSTDWFQRQEHQLRKLARALEQAKVGGARTSTMANAEEVEISRDRVSNLNLNALDDIAVYYQEAEFSVPRRVEPHEMPLGDLAEIILQIVDFEAPIHSDEVVNRVRDLWGFARAGSRIQSAVMAGIQRLLVSGKLIEENAFLLTPGSKVVVRNRERTVSNSLRRPDMIAPSEFKVAILAVVQAGHGITRPEIPVAVARLFGFKNTSAQLRLAIESSLADLEGEGKVDEIHGVLRTN